MLEFIRQSEAWTAKIAATKGWTQKQLNTMVPVDRNPDVEEEGDEGGGGKDPKDPEDVDDDDDDDSVKLAEEMTSPPAYHFPLTNIVDQKPRRWRSPKRQLPSVRKKLSLGRHLPPLPLPRSPRQSPLSWQLQQLPPVPAPPHRLCRNQPPRQVILSQT